MITPEDVKKAASLSRIHLRDEELKHLTADLEEILNYINQLEELDLKTVEPTSHVLPLKNVYREDVAQKPLLQEEALKNAPDRAKNHFKVPKVIE